MRFSTAATIGGLAALASASSDYWAQASVMCTNSPAQAVTATVTASGAAAVALVPTGNTPPPPMSSYVTTAGWTVTSVDYGMMTTSTYLPSAGVYVNPYGSDSITVGKNTWATVSKHELH